MALAKNKNWQEVPDDLDPFADDESFSKDKTQLKTGNNEKQKGEISPTVHAKNNWQEIPDELDPFADDENFSKKEEKANIDDFSGDPDIKQEPEAKQEPRQPQTYNPNDISGISGLKDFEDSQPKTNYDDEDKYKNVFEAPELNNLDEKSFKVALGGLLTSNKKDIAKIIHSHYPEAKITKNKHGDPIVTLPSGKYLAGKHRLEGQDIGRLVAQIGLFALNPSKGIVGAGVGDATIQSLMGETREGLGGSKLTPTEILETGGLGSAGNLVGKVASGEIKEGIKGLRGKSVEGNLINSAKKHGVELGTTDVFPPQSRVGGFAKSVGEDLPLTGVGSRKFRQAKQRQAATEYFIAENEGDLDTFINKVKENHTNVIKEAVAKRESVIEKVGNVSILPHSRRTLNAIRAEIKRLSTLPNGQPRATIKQGSIDTLEKYAKDLENGNDFKTLTDLRTTLREDLKPDFGKLGSREEGAVKNIYAAMTRDLDDVVRRTSINDLDDWQQSNHIFFDEANKVKNSKVKNILNANKRIDGSISKEELVNALLHKDSVAREQLYNSLDEEGRNHARGLIINKMASDSSQTGELSVNQFLRKLTQNKEKLDTWFSGEHGKRLNDLMQVLRATQSAQGTGFIPKTGQTTIPYIVGAVLGFKGLIGGQAYRVYESKAVRQSILAIKKYKRGSRGANEAVKNLLRLATSASQAATSEPDKDK